MQGLPVLLILLGAGFSWARVIALGRGFPLGVALLWLWLCSGCGFALAVALLWLWLCSGCGFALAVALLWLWLCAGGGFADSHGRGFRQAGAGGFTSNGAAMGRGHTARRPGFPT